MDQPKRIERCPVMDFKIRLSRDGKYWIFVESKTWIVPRNYTRVIEENHGKEAAEAVPAVSADSQEKAWFLEIVSLKRSKADELKRAEKKGKR